LRADKLGGSASGYYTWRQGLMEHQDDGMTQVPDYGWKQSFSYSFNPYVLPACNPIFVDI